MPADLADLPSRLADVDVGREPGSVYGVTKAYIAASHTGRLDYDQQLARQGFEALNVETELRKPAEHPALSPSVMLVGGVDEVHHALRRAGKQRPAWSDYPPELGEFYGRRLLDTTWGELERLGGTWFVKRPGKGSFQPGVMRFPFKPSGGELDYNACHVDDDSRILASEPVNFVAEWRAFCIDGEVADVRQYSGHWWLRYDRSVVEVAAATFKPTLRGYSIDIGRTSDERTLIVETNAGHSLGAYGLRPDLYATLLAAAWSGVWGEP